MSFINGLYGYCNQKKIRTPLQQIMHMFVLESPGSGFGRLICAASESIDNPRCVRFELVNSAIPWFAYYHIDGSVTLSESPTDFAWPHDSPKFDCIWSNLCLTYKNAQTAGWKALIDQVIDQVKDIEVKLIEPVRDWELSTGVRNSIRLQDRLRLSDGFGHSDLCTIALEEAPEIRLMQRSAHRGIEVG